MIRIVDRKNSVLNRFMAEIRDRQIQKDSMRFRKNVERVGEIMAYEVSKTFDYKMEVVETPLAPYSIFLPQEKVVVATVLRAGLPFHQGFMNFFDHAESAFIAARRVEDHEHDYVDVRFDSVYTPDLEGKQLLLVDPMLATGSSLVKAYRELLKQGGEPVMTHIVSMIASKPGVGFVEKTLAGQPVTLWTASLDFGLTENFYITPGIGDAGDLAFGAKK